MELASKDLCTLQFGALWVLSALTGTAARFRSYELDAFWDTVVAVTLRTTRGDDMQPEDRRRRYRARAATRQLGATTNSIKAGRPA